MQFNQPDSVIPEPYNTLDWNRYAYARYNPLVYTDPTGHDPVHEFFGGLLKELARTNFWWHPGYQRDLAIKNNESTAELTGRLVADVASIAIGAVEGGLGTGVAGGGVAACVTGVGCPGGALAIAGGGVLIYQGAGTVLNAGNNAGTILAMLSNGSGNQSGDEGDTPYYVEGKPYTNADLEDAILKRRDIENVTSDEFPDFIRSQGRSFRSNEWKKVMETWELPDGTLVENHYWRHKSGETWYHK